MNVTDAFMPDKSKTPAEQMDEVLNHMRAQMDFLCRSAEFQNNILKELYSDSCQSCKECKDSND